LRQILACAPFLLTILAKGPVSRFEILFCTLEGMP
jgi:hypothetical protein